MKIDTMFDCPRCEAKGYIKAFQHIANGLCFLCSGEKKITNLNALTDRLQEGEIEVIHFVSPFETDSVMIAQYGFIGKGARQYWGQIWSHTMPITEENKIEMRAFWKECKRQGYKLSTRYTVSGDPANKEDAKALMDPAYLNRVPAKIQEGIYAYVQHKAFYQLCNVVYQGRIDAPHAEIYASELN